MLIVIHDKASFVTQRQHRMLDRQRSQKHRVRQAEWRCWLRSPAHGAGEEVATAARENPARPHRIYPENMNSPTNPLSYLADQLGAWRAAGTYQPLRILESEC